MAKEDAEIPMDAEMKDAPAEAEAEAKEEAKEEVKEGEAEKEAEAKEEEAEAKARFDFRFFGALAFPFGMARNSKELPCPEMPLSSWAFGFAVGFGFLVGVGGFARPFLWHPTPDSMGLTPSVFCWETS
ncbi:unnamed protein product [Effrenium voratum]|nr:unnamed protein product [Effrenium voratum]